MRHLTFASQPSYPVCLLVPEINQHSIEQAYIYPHVGMVADDMVVLDLHQSGKKTPMKEMQAYITEELIPVWTDLKVEYLLVADADYFKALTKAAKVEVHLGYVMDCVFGPWKVVYVPNYRAIFYDPDKVKSKIALGIEAVIKHRSGHYQAPGASIISFAAYPTTVEEIQQWLERLIVEDRPLTCDIEAFSLKHPTAGIGTITFCWNQHEGISFPVDLGPDPTRVRALLKSFFLRFKSKLIYHAIAYDVYVLIYQLFMDHILDTKGLLRGLEVMLRNWDDTKLITYLATNSCAGNQLGLKVQAQEFAGNYAVEEIHDITKIPLSELLQYNLVDGLSTWYVHNKHYQTMVNDDQLPIYENLFKLAIVDIIQMQLTGMPLNMTRVKEVRGLLEIDHNRAIAAMRASPIVHQFEHELELRHIDKRNAELVKKRIALGDEPQTFNPNSGPQLQAMLFDMLGLPVISLTKTKQPSTDADTMEALLNHTKDPQILEFLKALIDYNSVDTILTSFIPAMEAAFEGPDGWHYLFGNFNLGGTLSGRLSSSKPNLQNLPANSKYAKLIKSCFQAPPGWLLCGLDFNSLEDKISGLTSKDPNKLKVYTDGYDGHSLRAFAYFGEQMPDIVDTVVSINSIQDKYKPLRQDSKVPTFALTYDGTWRTIMTKCGFSEAKAKQIEARYHELYAVSDAWVSAKLDEAGKTGYITAAFGLRVRTPLLKQVIRKTKRTPYEAEGEGRSAGNALGQSWCLLNSRAGVEFNSVVRASPFRLDIRPCAQIHDAQYFIIRDCPAAVAFTNKHLVKAVEWQEHPDIAHDEVKLGGELFICWPSWEKEITIPNGANENDIIALVNDHLAKEAA